METENFKAVDGMVGMRYHEFELIAIYLKNINETIEELLLQHQHHLIY